MTKAAPPAADVVRGTQVPTSRSEARFKARAAELGWKAHRPSWPDFLVETSQGIIAVEVKSSRDHVSKTQQQTFTILEAYGLPVYVWTNADDAKDRLVRWKKPVAP